MTILARTWMTLRFGGFPRWPGPLGSTKVRFEIVHFRWPEIPISPNWWPGSPASAKRLLEIPPTACAGVSASLQRLMRRAVSGQAPVLRGVFGPLPLVTDPRPAGPERGWPLAVELRGQVPPPAKPAELLAVSPKGKRCRCLEGPGGKAAGRCWVIEESVEVMQLGAGQCRSQGSCCDVGEPELGPLKRRTGGDQ